MTNPDIKSIQTPDSNSEREPDLAPDQSKLDDLNSEKEPDLAPDQSKLDDLRCQIEVLKAEVEKAELEKRLTEMKPVTEEVEGLRAEVEKEELKRRLTEMKNPVKSIWERPALLTFFVGVLSAVPPTVTAVHGVFATKLASEVRAVELGQEEERLKNEAIKQALDADLSLAHRFRALRYLQTSKNDDIKNWATKELDIAKSYGETEGVELQRQIDLLKDELEELIASGADAATIRAMQNEIKNLEMQQLMISTSPQAHNQPSPDPPPEQG